MSICNATSLRVDLTHGKIEKSQTPDNGIGGRTWNSVTLMNELKPGVDPLGPDNILCIGVGP
ncbi:MAG: aldehyde ferredoxin oxidoreductase N-terminal domain-containing protein, partial [Candidatus Marinimicrobia bacterium]|nr:aldehyde ferredoxin oxidoreductase N-terminal domain-containing protein [Candidatus Neomarinimicrobiota bacterium]